jgi:predicted adenylyl cyclase CyaB
MREVELKAVVDDLTLRRSMIEKAGGHLTYEGRLIDRRYGDASGRMSAADQVLRLRVYESADGRKCSLDWKGPTSFESGYKIRDEISTEIADPESLAQILENLGYAVILEIEREIAQYELGGAAIRFEVYPAMDVLAEVEGTPDQIETAIMATGIDRIAFTSERLATFVARYEARTGRRAALSSRELAGDYAFSRSST